MVPEIQISELSTLMSARVPGSLLTCLRFRFSLLFFSVGAFSRLCIQCLCLSVFLNSQLLSSSDPHPDTLFRHTIWKYILDIFIYIYNYIYHILSDIPSGIYSDILSVILSGIYSDILPGILPDILSGILSGIYSDIISDIPSDILSGIVSGIYSDILSDMGTACAH